jgi:hypothetical protein
MRPRSVIGLGVAAMLLLVAVVWWRIDQAHETTISTATVTGPLVQCSAGAFRPALDASGSAPDDYELRDVRCSGDYGHVTVDPADDQVDLADALFRVDASGWHLLTLGTSLGTAGDNDIPEDDFARIMGERAG